MPENYFPKWGISVSNVFWSSQEAFPLNKTVRTPWNCFKMTHTPHTGLPLRVSNRRFSLSYWKHNPCILSYEKKGKGIQKNLLAVHFPPSNYTYLATIKFSDSPDIGHQPTLSEFCMSYLIKIYEKFSWYNRACSSFFSQWSLCYWLPCFNHNTVLVCIRWRCWLAMCAATAYCY